MLAVKGLQFLGAEPDPRSEEDEVWPRMVCSASRLTPCRARRRLAKIMLLRVLREKLELPVSCHRTQKSCPGMRAANG